MSISLRIEGGDLVVGNGRSYSTVSGSDKLAQDLRLWVLAKIGTDPSTPEYGTSFDGGFVNGQAVEPVIGQLMTAQRVLEVRAAMIDLLSNYQATQLARIKQDMVDFNGQKTLTPDETIQNIVNVEATAIADTIIVRATVQTMSNTTLNVTLPVSI